MAPSVGKKPSTQLPPQPERAEREKLRPFSLRELDKLPTATDQDPPYRPWWVIDLP